MTINDRLKSMERRISNLEKVLRKSAERNVKRNQEAVRMLKQNGRA